MSTTAKAETRSERVVVLLSPSEKALLAERSRLSGMSFADLIRNQGIARAVNPAGLRDASPGATPGASPGASEEEGMILSSAAGDLSARVASATASVDAAVAEVERTLAALRSRAP